MRWFQPRGLTLTACSLLTAGLLAAGLTGGAPAFGQDAPSDNPDPVADPSPVTGPAPAPTPTPAPDVPFDVILTFHITDDTAFGRSFMLFMAPAASAGAPVPVLGKVSGKLEVCVKGPESGGRIAVVLGDAAVERTADGCETIEISDVDGVALQAQHGAWDVIVRRLRPDRAGIADTAPSDTQYIFARVPRTASFGRQVALTTGAPGTLGALPEPAKPYTGRLEICARGSGRLSVFLDDAKQAPITTAGCQSYTASAVTSATFVAEAGELWEVAVRLLP